MDSDPSLADVDHRLRCNATDCGEQLNAAEWFWYVDAGSAHLTFCRDCGDEAAEFEDYYPATAVQLTTDDGEQFARLIDLTGTFHYNHTPNP